MLTRNRSLRRSLSLLPTSFPLLAVLACALLGALALAGGCRTQNEPGDVADLPDAGRLKLDPELYRVMSRLSASGKGDSLLSVLVKVKAGMDDPSELTKAGLHVESTIGEVVAGRASPTELAKVAMIPDVVHIEPATTYRTGQTEQP